ncbi:MAG: peptidoglycan-binding protein [Chthoniobacterales bacterium]
MANRTRAANSERVIGRYSANNWHRSWDRGRDHFWHGHRCHFRNGFWFIYDPFLYSYPWDYGYYPYGPYYSSYYDDGAYPTEEYAQAPDAANPEYSGDARVNDVQSALAREGYYDGAVDGKLGPATRNALRRYQRDHGLDVTGGITSGVIRALRLR